MENGWHRTYSFSCYWPWGSSMFLLSRFFFEIIGKGFVKILAFTNEGVTFLLKEK